jgi:putative phosphoribosyl transferase
VFQDRAEAGRRLATKLVHLKGQDAVVFALPRGGVPVAEPIAAMLRAPLDLILARKIGVPRQPELAMGAVADGGSPVVVRNEDVIAMAGVDEAAFDAASRRELREIERRRRRYLGTTRAPCEAEGRVAIVVDDGVATGATTRAALRAIRARRPKTLILAVPVAPPDALEALKGESDETICLEVHADFGAIGYFYADFHQLDDDEVIAILDRFEPRKAKLADPTPGPKAG